MVVRRFRDTDAGGVIALWTAVLPDSSPHNEPEASLKRKLALDRDLLFVAVEEDVLVGAVMGGYDGHRGWVYSLAVRPDSRLAGIGAELVRRLEAELVERGCLKVNLQVRATNAGVVSFYRKLGYSVEERVSMGQRLYG